MNFEYLYAAPLFIKAMLVKNMIKMSKLTNNDTVTIANYHTTLLTFLFEKTGIYNINKPNAMIRSIPRSV